MIDRRIRHTRCACGDIEMALSGEPIVSAACCCASCHEAGERLGALPGGHSPLESDGSTKFHLYRKDRISCGKGESLLVAHRLTPTSTTRRFVASCCNAPMFLEFKGGHWLSVYSHRVPTEDQVPLEMRTMTRDRVQGVEFIDGLPSYSSHSVRFIWRLFAAWAAMGFRAPKPGYLARQS